MSLIIEYKYTRPNGEVHKLSDEEVKNISDKYEDVYKYLRMKEEISKIG
ncbi:MAG: hypothetical protein ACRC92_26255 [Peptostreptococcaceae bacterium]